jgi:hypothetical protein
MVEAKYLAMNRFPDLFVIGVHDIGYARSKDFANTCRDNRACCRFRRKKIAGNCTSEEQTGSRLNTYGMTIYCVSITIDADIELDWVD